MRQSFVSWSGGKDSCFAAYLASKNGLDLRFLLNMVNEDGLRSWTHGLSSEILELQSQALGIPLMRQRTSGAEYESKFIEALKILKEKGVSEGVFGDIDFKIHRDWIECVCDKGDVIPNLPLWGLSQDNILSDFIKSGFEAILVVTKAELMGEDWLGRKINNSFVKDLKQLSLTIPVTPCGEAGEYHTIVIDGPLFNKRLELTETKKVLRDGYWFLDIGSAKLKDKNTKKSLSHSRPDRESGNRIYE